jgi:hypothetical protein
MRLWGSEITPVNRIILGSKSEMYKMIYCTDATNL